MGREPIWEGCGTSETMKEDDDAWRRDYEENCRR